MDLKDYRENLIKKVVRKEVDAFDLIEKLVKKEYELLKLKGEINE